jgi:hypothetical protein
MKNNLDGDGAINANAFGLQEMGMRLVLQGGIISVPDLARITSFLVLLKVLKTFKPIGPIVRIVRNCGSQEIKATVIVVIILEATYIHNLPQITHLELLIIHLPYRIIGATVLNVKHFSILEMMMVSAPRMV